MISFMESNVCLIYAAVTTCSLQIITPLRLQNFLKVTVFSDKYEAHRCHKCSYYFLVIYPIKYSKHSLSFS